MSKKSPIYLFALALVVVSLALLTGSAVAQTGTTAPTSSGEQLGPNDQHAIDNFLTNRPDVAEEIHKDPSLINNPQWLAQHPEVQHFMSTHPNVQKMAAEHPDWATKQAEHSAMMRGERGAQSTDQFLQNHPKVAQELANNPKLIDNKEYLAQHPALNTYLSNHPQIRNEWQQHPVSFDKAAEHYQEAQNKKAATAHAPAKK